MKNSIRTLTALTSLFFVATSVSAQDTVKVITRQEIIKEEVDNDKRDRVDPGLRRLELGARYMPTFVRLKIRNAAGDIIAGDVSVSHGWGAVLGLNLSKNLGVQAEVNYLDILQKYKDQNLERELRVSYLNIPVLLSLNTDKSQLINVNFVAGPQFGINVGSDIKTTGDQSQATVQAVAGASGTDLGLAYGAGVEIFLNESHHLRLDLGYRGFYGLVDITANKAAENPDTYNVVVRGSRMTNAGYVGLALCF